MSLSHQIIGPYSVAGGVNTQTDSAFLDESEAPFSINFQHRFGKLQLRPGTEEYDAFSTSVTGLTNPWIGIGDAAFFNATRYVLFHQPQAVWSYDGTTYTDRSGVGIITSGSSTQPWSNCFVLDKYFACNGANELIFWTGTGNFAQRVTAATMPSGLTALIGRYLASYAGRVVMGYTTEGGSAKTQRLRWCADSNDADWDTAAGTGAAFVDLSETPGVLVGLGTNAGYIVAYKEDAIILGQETGAVSPSIVFPITLKTGCLSGQTVQNITPTRQIFLGRDTFYVLEGQQITSIGHKIKNDLFFSGGSLRVTYASIRQFVSGVDVTRNLYYCGIVGSNVQNPSQKSTVVRFYVYNYLEDLWWVEEFPLTITSMAAVNVGSSPATLGTAPYNTSTLGGTYASRILGSFEGGGASPVMLIGTAYSSTSYRIFKFSGTNFDNGASSLPIANEWQSKDVRLNPEGESSLYRVKMRYNSTSAVTGSISISVNRGESFISSSSAAMAPGTGKVAEFYFEIPVTGTYHRVKLVINTGTSANTSSLEIVSLELWHTLRKGLR